MQRNINICSSSAQICGSRRNNYATNLIGVQSSKNAFVTMQLRSNPNTNPEALHQPLIQF